MKKNQDEAISAFEAELKAGKNPSVPEFVRRYGITEPDLAGALYMLQALYQDKERMKLPAGFKEEQAKLAQCLIEGKPTDWYFRKHRPAEMKVLDVPHPLTREYDGIPVVRLAAAGQMLPCEPDALMTIEGWEKITRPYDLPYKEIFAVRIKGDSLEPTIADGSYAVIDPRKEAKSGSLAMVINKEYEASIKLIKIRGPKVTLVSANPKYPPKEISRKDVWRMYPVVWVKFK